MFDGIIKLLGPRLEHNFVQILLTKRVFRPRLSRVDFGSKNFTCSILLEFPVRKFSRFEQVSVFFRAFQSSNLPFLISDSLGLEDKE